MLKKISIYIVIAFAVLAAAAAGTGGPFNFKLKDFNGKKHSLSDYKDSRAVVVIYIATRCPVSNAYNKRMEGLYREFAGKNIAFVGINSNKMESVEEVKEHAQKNGLTFPILKDDANVLADRYKASVTPEVYVLEKGKTLLYHGRIDDSTRENQVKSRDLYRALMEITGGKEVTVKQTKAFGCTIKRVEKVEK